MTSDADGPDEQKETTGEELPAGQVPVHGLPEDGLPEDGLPDSLWEQMTAAWDKREPKWYERLAPAQKHWVNKLVAIRLQEFEAHLAAQDREDSQLARQIAEVAAQLGQLNRRLAALEERVEHLGAQAAADDPAANRSAGEAPE